MKNTKKLIIATMSGGLDSSTLVLKALADGYLVQPVSFKYNQKHSLEVQALKEITSIYKEKYPELLLDTLTIDLSLILGPVLKSWAELRDSKKMLENTDMEFYTPSRNLVFSVLAGMIGEIIANGMEVTEVQIGLGIHEHETYDRDYWDISPEFIKRLDYLFELNDTMRVSMYTPYKDKTKDKIILDAIKLGVPIHKTWTCYDPITELDISKPCLICEACVERQQSGDKAGYSMINKYWRKHD